MPRSHHKAVALSALLVVHVGLVAGCLAAAEPAGREADAAAIRAAATLYMDALQRGEAKTLADLWTADGDIIDDAGQVLQGRETVAATTAGEPADPRPEFRMTETNLRFVTADVAIEDGQVEVTLPGGGTPLEGRFSATWVREAGTWKLAALREARDPEASGPETLRELDWMVGEWKAIDETAHGAEAADAKPAAELTMSVRWNDAHTFLVREMRIRPVNTGPETGPEKRSGLEISQRIGWDPLARRIRSWAFGSDGSHSEATWLRDGGSWVARTASVQPDGSQTSAINVYTFDGKDRCTMRSLHTHVGGEHMPPVALTLVRFAEGTK
jgi:uncharacterized protein (TIGR02246 family)